MSLKTTLYIYNDQGVSPESLHHTLYTLQSLVSAHYSLKTLNALEVQTGAWISDAALFIMPGGADRPYVKKLKGLGNAVIQSYVHNGGSYLGICAGAYYACQDIEFDKGGPLEVLGKRELQFFKGSAIGPVFAPYDYKSKKGARAAFICSTDADLKKNFSVFFNGGGYFADAEHQNVQILAEYVLAERIKKAALIRVQVGQGQAVLSGVHFEYVEALLDPTDPYIAPLLPDLANSRSARIQFTQKLLQLCGVSLIESI